MNRDKIQEIIRFCIVGAVTFVVDYGFLFFCTEFLSINYLMSAAIAFTIAVVFNYVLCIIFVFDNISKQNLKQQVLFVGSSVIGLGFNQICMYFFVEYLGIYYLLAKILSTIIVTLWNYIMKRKAVKI